MCEGTPAVLRHRQRLALARERICMFCPICCSRLLRRCRRHSLELRSLERACILPLYVCNERLPPGDRLIGPRRRSWWCSPPPTAAAAKARSHIMTLIILLMHSIMQRKLFRSPPWPAMLSLLLVSCRPRVSGAAARERWHSHARCLCSGHARACSRWSIFQEKARPAHHKSSSARGQLRDRGEMMKVLDKATRKHHYDSMRFLNCSQRSLMLLA